MADDDNIVINQDSYVAFDAVSLKDLIIERLNDNNNFTDQNYEGSNLSSLLDVICYSFHTLIYYLNKNSAETSFTQAEIYENINQIVDQRVGNLKPIGILTNLEKKQLTDVLGERIIDRLKSNGRWIEFNWKSFR